MPIPLPNTPAPWALEKSPALRGVVAKLDRAEQHISDLERAEDAFIGKTGDRFLLEGDPQLAEAFKRLHEGRIADLDLSVVTGEVLYQLRSSLDHIVCALIRKCGNEPTTKSQWPDLLLQANQERRHSALQGSGKGITDENILGVIEAFQPYMRDNHPILRRSAQRLAILKTLSNFDKHQAVALHVVKVEQRRTVQVPAQDGLVISIDGPDDGEHLAEDLAVGLDIVDDKRYLSTYVAFEKFGDSSRIGVVAGLESLRAAIDPIIGELWGEF